MKETYGRTVTTADAIVRPEEMRNTVMAMRNDAYRVMTGKDAPPMPDLTPPTPTGVKLGEQVHFDYSDILRRQSVTPYDTRQPMRKEWRKTQWGKRGDVRHGLIVGVRTLSNGVIKWNYEEPIQFYPDLHFTAYLVAFDLRRKPVFLLPDDVTRQA
jgi:hypothetical protein